MEIVFLGTSSGMPTRTRNVCAVAVRPRGGRWLLLDCGEATQHQIMRSGRLSVSRIQGVLVTHLHADHVLGLPGVLASRALQAANAPVRIIGPPGTQELVETILRMTATHVPFEISFATARPGVVWEEATFRVRCSEPLSHGIVTYGYRIEEPPRRGEFDVATARALGVPEGPLLGRLSRGEVVVLPNGRRIEGARLCGLPRPGASVAFCTDTTPCDAAVELVRGVDVLVHEATFTAADEQLAARNGHSTAAQAAEIARAAGVGRLVLTHVSARYADGNASAHLSEARQIFPATEVAEDFMVMTVRE